MSRPLARGGAVAGWPLHRGRPLRFAALVVREAPGGMAWLCRSDSGQAIALFEARAEAETWLRAWDAFVRRWHRRWQLGIERDALARQRQATALPAFGGRDGGPRAPGRGPVERATVFVEGYDPRHDIFKEMPQEVTRRACGHGLKALTPSQREVADRYASLVERVASVSAPGDGVRGGLSDGGASTRAGLVLQLRSCRCLIGSEPVELRRVPRGKPKAAPGKQEAPKVGQPFTSLDLVDAVVLHGQSCKDVLRQHGWPDYYRIQQRTARALRSAVNRLALAFVFERG